MIKPRIAVTAALLAVAGVASAGTSVTATWVSDYDWRGVTQTIGGDAVQLGATYTADSGFYAGLWGSSLSPGNLASSGSLGSEIDEFAGYTFGDSAKAVGVDLGVNIYSYSNAKDANFGEVYAGVSHGPFSAKLWYAPEISHRGFGGKDGKDAFYLEANATVPVANGVSLLAHVGFSNGDGIEAYYGAGKHYIDWSAGVGYDVSNFNVFLKYVDGSDNDAIDKLGSRFVFGIGTTLPWK